MSYDFKNWLSIAVPFEATARKLLTDYPITLHAYTDDVGVGYRNLQLAKAHKNWSADK